VSPERCSVRKPTATSQAGHGSNHALGPPAYRVDRHVRYDPAAVRSWLDAQDAYGR
jgi:hypothetical protein